jgi:4-hydroxy-tetrahydrodipicolinate reductase
MLRILHVGLGPLGQRIATDLTQRGLGRIAAAVDNSPTLIGTDFHGVKVSGDLDAALSSGSVDCALVTTSSDLARCAPTFLTLLRAGLAVVSTCEELLWPWLRHAKLAGELESQARQHGGRLLGTGINPGFLMDGLPAMASAVCSEVRSVEAWRIQDATPRRIPFQKKIGATLDRGAFAARIADGSLRHVGLGESLHFVASTLGLAVDRWEESLEPVIAEQALECGLGPIPAGHAAGVRQVARAFAGERCTVRLEFVAAVGQPDPHDRVRIEGTPMLDLRIDGGVHGDIGTSAMVLNSIHSLLAAQPGLHTMATVPMVTFCPAT